MVLLRTALALLCLSVTTANAALVKWELDLSDFAGSSATAIGSFVFNTNTQTFSDIDIDITHPGSGIFPIPPTSETVSEVRFAFFGSTFSNITFGQLPVADGSLQLRLDLPSSDFLTDTPPAAGISIGASVDYCADIFSFGAGCFGSETASGTITATRLVTAVPLPASSVLLAAGLGVLGWRARRRTQNMG